MADGWICVQYSEGTFDYVIVEFHINGILPTRGWKITFAENGMSVSFKRATHKLLYAKEHLKAIMPAGEYSNTHSRVIAVDDNAQRMVRDGVDAKDEYYWGKEQVANLKVRCTGTPIIGYKEYPTGLYINDKHKQFNCVCTCKVQVAEQRTSTILGVERDVVNMFDLPSSQSSADLSALNRCNRAGGGKCKFQ